jgi:HK97 family phage major capsid protein
VVEVGSRDWKALVSSNDLTNGWVGDGDSRSESTTSRLFERSPTFGTVYSYPFASEEVVQDAFFDIGAWLAEEAADGFAAAEATAIVSGNGTSRPTGFLNTTPTTSSDSASPERAAGILEYLPINPATSPTTTIGDEALADALIALSYAVHERFTLDGSSTAFVMRRATGARVRKCKDQNDQYLWTNLASGQPATLLGHPVVFTDAMPAIANDAFPIAFGNWRRGYVICDRVGTMQITHDNNITTPGKHKFYMRRVVGGCILNHQAIKVLKVGD